MSSLDSFLPFFITENPGGVLGGNLTLQPVLSPSEIDEWLAKLNAKYPDPSLEKGYLVNTSSMFALSLSMYPITYNNGQFSPIHKEFADLGDKAVVIHNPLGFVERVRNAIARQYPNVRFLEMGSICYMDASEQWELYARGMENAWQHEILLCAKLKPMITFESSAYAQVATLDIGDISSIATVVSVDDLIRGSFPAYFHEPDFIAMMDSFVPMKKGIQNCSFSVMANVMDIMPEKRWMDAFAQVLGEEWIANTFLERLYEDADAMARLVFHHANGVDKLRIGINRVELSFARFGDREQKLLQDIFQFIHGKLALRYCRMSVVTHANLGSAREPIALENGYVKEVKIKNSNGLQVTHDIETDFCVNKNILGADMAQRAWHYVIRTQTPEQETILWYDLQDVMSFFAEASKYNESVIHELLKGNAYDRYREI